MRSSGASARLGGYCGPRICTITQYVRALRLARLVGRGLGLIVTGGGSRRGLRVPLPDTARLPRKRLPSPPTPRVVVGAVAARRASARGAPEGFLRPGRPGASSANHGVSSRTLGTKTRGPRRRSRRASPPFFSPTASVTQGDNPPKECDSFKGAMNKYRSLVKILCKKCYPGLFLLTRNAKLPLETQCVSDPRPLPELQHNEKTELFDRRNDFRGKWERGRYVQGPR